MKSKLYITVLLICLALIVHGQSASSAKEIKPLGVGTSIPNSTLLTVNNEKVKVHDIVQGQNTILIFYRGGWCPYCNIHLAELAQSEEEIRNLGFQIIGISPDDIANLQPTIDKDEISYTLYSDPDSELIHKMKLAFKPDCFTRLFLKSRTEGKATDTLPVPAVYIVDKEGVIQYVHFDPNYIKRLSADELIKVIQDLNTQN